MRIDLHTHCLPVSVCARVEPEQLPELFRENGVDAIVLTNHCYPRHCDLLGDTLKEQAEKYIEIYHRCKAKGDETGVKVFFGAEIKLMGESNKPEFLLYGLSEQDFLDSYPMYNCTQRELYQFCEEKDILMVQAHPFRTEQGYAPADMAYVHGVEAYNGHPRFDPRLEDCLKLAQGGKCITAGSDFHYDFQAGSAGMIIPDEISDQFMLRDYLRTGKRILFNQNGIVYTER
jgi:hypothetical protein